IKSSETSMMFLTFRVVVATLGLTNVNQPPTQLPTSVCYFTYAGPRTYIKYSAVSPSPCHIFVNRVPGQSGQANY
ncbi:hypothetical protein CPC08DRAFT_708250, partial [Agrocybe pediades]